MLLRHNRGFNLVELMVAMVAGLLLVAAASALFASIPKANRTAMQMSRLNQELQSITDMMARDIQRAGYDASAAAHTLVSGATSPFYFDSTKHLLNKYSSSPDQFRCIALKYDERDENATPSPGQPEDNEVVVYSYHSASLGGSVWMAGLPASAAEQTSAALQTLVDACSDEDVADPISTNGAMKITDLTFTLLPSSASSGARTIRLTITGNDIKSPALALTLQRDIKLRNDVYCCHETTRRFHHLYRYPAAYLDSCRYFPVGRQADGGRPQDQRQRGAISSGPGAGRAGHRRRDGAREH